MERSEAGAEGVFFIETNSGALVLKVRGCLAVCPASWRRRGSIWLSQGRTQASMPVYVGPGATLHGPTAPQDRVHCRPQDRVYYGRGRVSLCPSALTL